MSDQGQHRISKVYLKEFGFRDKNNKWWVSTWKLGEEYTANKSIKSFTKELNVFDLPFHDLKTRRSLEGFSSNIESSYPRIISEIRNNKKLSEESIGFLSSFMIDILCRTTPFRNKIDYLLRSEKRNYFFSEINSYDEEIGKVLIEKLRKIKIDYQLNFIMLPVWHYFLRKLISSNFDYVILKDYDNRGWITTDNPVVLINNVNENTLFSKETEIYFPLSKNYCLYIDNRDYNRSNSLRGENGEELVEINEELQEKVYDNISRNAYQYVIHPVDLGRVKLSASNPVLS